MASSPRQGIQIIKSESGAVMVEFALIAFVFYLLIAMAIEMGRMIFIAQAAQEAAGVAARELSLTPLPASITFEEALQEPQVVTRLFDPDLLVIDLAAFPTDEDLQAFFETLPLVNQMLRPMMIVDHSGDTTLLRYPGALLNDPVSSTGYGVRIPRVVSRGAGGAETICWTPVLEEITGGAFSLDGGAPQSGMAAVRINYPFQAASLSGFLPNPAGLFEPSAGPIGADDGAVQIDPDPACALPAGTSLFAPVDPGEPQAVGTHAGSYGLGGQFAFARTVRPFRKLLAGQAIFRREVVL